MLGILMCCNPSKFVPASLRDLQLSAERNRHLINCISNEFVNLNTKANRANTQTIYQEHDLLKTEVTRLFTAG